MQTTPETPQSNPGHKKSGRLGELLIKENSITPAQLDQALELQQKQGGRLGTCLIKLGFLSGEEITATLSRQCGIPAVNLASCRVDPGLIRLVPMETALNYQVLPLSRVGSSLTLAMADPSNVSAMEEVKLMTGFNIEPVVSSEASLEQAIRMHYGTIEDQENRREIEELVSLIDTGQTENVEVEAEERSALNLAALEKAAEEAPVIKLVNYILTDAAEHGASDIHVEAYEKECRVRCRIDGVLQNVMQPPVKLRDAMISRLKKMARLDTSEKRLPQDGRIGVRMLHGGRKKEFDLRVSVLPTVFGEKIVIRLFDKENLRLDMAELGFEPEALEKYQRAICRPSGLVLGAGPAGSGKTSTLYSSLLQLNKPDVNILTAEDPVEFQLPGVNQVQMKEQIGLDLAAALRAFLRQDPDVIMVGELRDSATAGIAIKAALTGHLVLSTLPTSDAAFTISRLLDMGIEPFLVATSIHVICAQRLVRRICPQCKVEDHVQPKALLDAGFAPAEVETVKVYRGAGCPACNNKGYKGRVGIFEVLETTGELRELILAGASAEELKKKAIEQGMTTLRRSGLMKVAAGITTLEEVIRETAL
ncbi:MAG: type IV-A pilus assembly ATPase PilB [Acidobacteriota bacterium]